VTGHDNEEELRQLRAALRQSQRELATLGLHVENLERELRLKTAALNGAWGQLEALRHSTSWTITAPIRRIKGALR
jgi:chromosome segregation ATPase